MWKDLFALSLQIMYNIIKSTNNNNINNIQQIFYNYPFYFVMFILKLINNKK